MLNKKLFLVIVFILALLLRICFFSSAYHGDLNNNISWGSIAYERGLSGFYDRIDPSGWPYSVPNQPPLTIMTFWAVRAVWQGIENLSWQLNRQFPLFPSPFIWFWEAKGMVLLIKLPGILADLGIGYLIYKIVQSAKGKVHSNKLGKIAAGVWLFNPVSWYVSSIWGQTDSVVNFLGLIGIFYLLKKKLIPFVLFLTLSLLFKGSLTVFIPLLLFVALWQRHSLSDWIKAISISLVAVIATSIWFHPRWDLLFWVVNLYRQRIFPGEIGYLTANAFNFWWLVNPGRVLDSTLYLDLPARVWGFILVILGVGWSVYRLKKEATEKNVLLSLALVALLTFLFLTRIHERYLYPFFPLATLLLAFVKKIKYFYIVLSLTFLLNLYHLFWAPPMPFLEALYKGGLLALAISIINIATFFYLLRQFKQAKI